MDKYELLKRLYEKSNKLRDMALELDWEADFVIDIVLDGKEAADYQLEAISKYCEGKMTKKRLIKLL